MEALNVHTTLEISPPSKHERDRDHSSIEARLRRQMAADALQPLGALNDGVGSGSTAVTPTTFSSEILEESSHFLRLHVRIPVR